MGSQTQAVCSVASVKSDSLRPYGVSQAPLSIGLSWQEYWSGLPCPSSRNLPDPGIKPVSLPSPALAGRFFTTSATRPGSNPSLLQWKHRVLITGLSGKSQEEILISNYHNPTNPHYKLKKVRRREVKLPAPDCSWWMTKFGFKSVWFPHLCSCPFTKTVLVWIPLKAECPKDLSASSLFENWPQGTNCERQGEWPQQEGKAHPWILFKWQPLSTSTGLPRRY